MAFWTVEVKSGASLRVDPVEGKSVHISQATLGKSDTNENVSVQLYMKAGDHKIGIGTLPNGKIPQLSMQILLDKGFELSHSWKNGSVHFSGYVIGPTEPANDEMADNDAGAGAIGGGGDQVNSLLRNEDDDSETVEEMFRYVDKLKKVVEEVGDSLLEKADLKMSFDPKPTFAPLPNTSTEFFDDQDFFFSAKKLHLATRFTEEMLTTNEIKHFFEEKANIMIVRVEKKWDAWDEELKAKVFEALVVFPTHQDLKKALDLEGREYNGRVYYLSEVVGRFVVYAVGDLENISTDKDIVAQELTRKFKKCAVEKILLPLNKETGEILGFGYLVVRRDELAANPEALNLKDLDVRHCPEIRKGLLKALMMKNGSSVHFSGNNIGPTEPSHCR